MKRPTAYCPVCGAQCATRMLARRRTDPVRVVGEHRPASPVWGDQTRTCKGAGTPPWEPPPALDPCGTEPML